MKRIVSILIALSAAAVASSCVIDGDYTFTYKNDTQYEVEISAIFIQGGTHYGTVAPGEVLTAKELGGGPIVLDIEYADTGVMFHYSNQNADYKSPARYECYEADGNNYIYTFDEDSFNFAKEMNEQGITSDSD